jgi:hypothetical protein
MTVLVQDLFNGTNGTDITAHSPDIDTVGDGWVDNGSNTVELDGSGELKFSSGSDYCLIDAGTADQIVTATLNAGGADNRFSICVRSDGLAPLSNTVYLFNIRPAVSGSDNVFITPYVSGTSGTDVSTEITLNSSTTYEVECSVIGSSLVFKVDGVTVLTTTDTSITTGDFSGLIHALRIDGALRISDFVVEDSAGTTITITESLATLNITSVDPVIDFTGLISIVEGSEPLNITSIDPTVTLTATLTITESTSTLNITNNDPDITLTAPDTLVITESTATLNITTQSPNITLSGTLSIVESTKTIDMLTRNPSVTLGLPVYTQTFTGIQKTAEFTGTTKLYGFTGTITELQTFSGTAKAASFLGVTE